MESCLLFLKGTNLIFGPIEVIQILLRLPLLNYNVFRAEVIPESANTVLKLKSKPTFIRLFLLSPIKKSFKFVKSLVR